MHRISLMLLVLVSLPPWAARADVPEKDLRRERGYLPYTVEVVPRLLPALQGYPSRGLTFLFVDFDGDGRDEMVRADAQGVVVEDLQAPGVAIRRRDLPAEFARPGQPAFSLGTCPDLGHDGRPEITAIGHTPNRFGWRLWVLDSADLHVISTTQLPRGEDVRPDGRWDGFYHHAAALPGAAAPTRPPLLILTCGVMSDRDGRGVLAVNPLSGDISWFHHTAGMPNHESMVAEDVDGDGAAEIIFTADTPVSRSGLMVNGYTDNEACLAVLNGDGSTRWTAALGQGLGGSDLEVVTLADGQPYIVTTQWTTPAPSGALRMWSLDGDLLASHESALQYTGLAQNQPVNRTELELLVTTSYGTLEVFHATPRHFVQTWAVHLPSACTVNGVFDILPAAGAEILITDKTGRLLVLGPDYEPLAAFDVRAMAWQGQAQVLQTAADQTEVVLLGARQGSLAFTAAPTPYSAPASYLVAIVLGGLALLALGWLTMHYRRKRLAPELQSEVRLHLLESLELSRHGNIAPLNAVRRLSFCLRALKSDIGDTSRVNERLGEILSECLGSSLPHLTGIMDRARLSDLDSQTVEDSERAVATVRRLVHKLANGGNLTDPSAQMVADLDAAKQEAESCLRRLRQEVARYFRADPQRSLERVLLANKDRINEVGAKLVRKSKVMAAAGGSAAANTRSARPLGLPPGTTCQIEPADLDQVLDNVIANAVQAMRETAVRHLLIDKSLVDGMVLIDVSDTGCGIAPANRDRVLNTHYSTKNGGGTGLLASRKILHRYSGRLTILSSVPQRGTTVRISLVAG